MDIVTEVFLVVTGSLLGCLFLIAIAIVIDNIKIYSEIKRRKREIEDDLEL